MGEPPREPAEAPVHLEAEAADNALIYQAGRDQYFSVASPPEREFVVAEALAGSVMAHWNDEVKARNLGTRDLLAVRWQGDALLRGHEVSLGGAVSGLMNQVQGMVDKFMALAPQRLILVGPPGSGKTALAIVMMQELLARRHPRSAVPVMLSLSSWDMRGSLRSWISQRIVSEYMPETEDRHQWRFAVDRLIQRDLIIPILDGLDELAVQMRGPALEAINKILPAQPLILTCRREEYSELVCQAGPLNSAAASEALPVTPRAVADYLRTRPGVRNGETWEPVVKMITAEPDSPVGHALSRPLMVSLLATVYEDAKTDPTEILDRARFDSAKSIERHLYAGLLALFKSRMHLSIDGKAWKPDRAIIWLSNLATHLSRSQIYDIVMWQLAHAVSRTQRVLAAAMAALAGGIIAGTLRPLVLGLAGGISAGLAVGLAVSLARRRKDGPTTRLPVTSGRNGSAFIRGNGPLHTVAFSGFTGLAAALLTNYLLSGLPHRDALYAGCIAALLAGTPVGVPGWQPMTVFKELNSSKAPRRQLVEERRNNLGFALATVCALALAVGLAGWTDGGLAVGFLLGSTASFVIDKLSMAWWSYSMARLLLASGGTLPWRLVKFLEDSYEYGVLRRAGGVYQFRHAGLQDYLAEP
jgi:hypothetical protein